MIEKILNFIEALKKKPQLTKYDETETKQAMILPVLQLLGWNVWDTEEVKPEYPVEGKKAAEGGKVDFCLRIKGKSEVFLEAKRPGEDLEKHQEQLLDYSFREGLDLSILTNGISWWFYLPRKKVPWKDRKFYAIDILQQSVNELAEKFIQLLSREKVRSGEALENAKFIYEQLDRQKKINETLHKAWNKLIIEGGAGLYNLLAETTESICGFRPDDEDVKNMFIIYKANLILPEMPFKKTLSKVKPEIKSGITKYTPENKRLYKEFFQKLLEKSDKETGLKFKYNTLEKEFLNTATDNYGNAYYLSILKNKAIVELSNYGGRDREKVIFDKLISQKDNIEKEMGFSLEWRRNDNKNNWRIMKHFEEGGRDNKESWPTLQDKMIDAMSKFINVFSPRLKELGKLKNKT